MRCVARIGNRKGTEFCWRNLQEGDHFGDVVDLDGRIILKLILKKSVGRRGWG
jgi:uncharacterized protein (UPF0128 family)